MSFATIASFPIYIRAPRLYTVYRRRVNRRLRNSPFQPRSQRGATGAGLGVLATVAWGGQIVTAKGAFVHLGPFELNALRFIPVPFVLLPLLVLTEGRTALRLEGRFRRIAVLGLVVGSFNLLNLIGLAYTRPQNASLINATTPLVAAIVIWTRYRARPRSSTFLFLCAAAIGIVLVISRGHPASYLSSSAHWGDVFCFLATISFAAYTVVAADDYGFSPLRLATFATTIATVTLCTAWLVAVAVHYEAPATTRQLVQATPAIAYLAFAGGVLAMFAWTASTQRIGGQNTALLANLIPIVVFAFELLRGYRPNASEIIGAVIVIGAVTANNLLARRPTTRAEAQDVCGSEGATLYDIGTSA